MALTYRGRRVATLIPEEAEDARRIAPDDPIFGFVANAEPMGGMTSEKIDRLLYGGQTDLR